MALTRLKSVAGVTIPDDNASTVVPCPLWVKSGHCITSASCPLYPRKQTLAGDSWMSALCQQRTFADVRLMSV
jgi:hypothetical protein